MKTESGKYCLQKTKEEGLKKRSRFLLKLSQSAIPQGLESGAVRQFVPLRNRRSLVLFLHTGYGARAENTLGLQNGSYVPVLPVLGSPIETLGRFLVPKKAYVRKCTKSTESEKTSKHSLKKL